MAASFTRFHIQNSYFFVHDWFGDQEAETILEYMLVWLFETIMTHGNLTQFIHKYTNWSTTFVN